MSYCIGFDIGGTKCAVSLGEIMDGNIRVLHRQETPTVATAQETLSVLAPFVKEWVKKVRRNEGRNFVRRAFEQ